MSDIKTDMVNNPPHYKDAMFNIRSQQWEYVIEYIKAEIARLESEDEK